jgi:bifunctional non-homologous end joining protein LigD
MKAAGRTSLPKGVQPMLATLTARPFDNPDWLFELKMDGMRALVIRDGEKLEMRTRNNRSLTERFPAMASSLKELPADSMVLDGEIVALDENGHSRFELLQPRIHLSRAHDVANADDQNPVYYYAFDLLFINGYDLARFPLEQRKAVLRKLIPTNDGWVRFNDHIEARGKDFFEVVSKRGLEGIVAKHRTSPYQQTRSRYWLKIKTQHTDHFVIGGFTPPEGSRQHFGAVLLGLYNKDGELIPVGRAGSGFDDATLRDVWQKLRRLETPRSAFRQIPPEIRRSTWVEPKLVCEVRFNEWTTARQLRAPIFQGLRDDIDPADCKLEDSIPEKKSTPPPEIVTQAELTNQDKVFWPEDGYTKGDLIRFYDRIAPVLVPHLLDRPLVFDRYPDGIYGQHFYQKDAHDYTPEWIRTQEIWASDVERSIRYFIGADRDQLIYIANMGAIAQNPWSSRVQFIDYPDYVIFDLDPVDAPYDVVQEVALVLKSIFDELHLRAYPKTSGASGIHVYLPVLENRFTYEDIRVFAEAIAKVVVQSVPEIATIERAVRKRKPGVVYVDYLQNIKGKTVASVYSPRAVPGACVSTPLKWEEFKKPLDPRDYTIVSVCRRIDKFGDLFGPVLTDRQDISGFLKVLRK